MINKVTVTAIINIRLRCSKRDMGDSERWRWGWWMWCRLWGDLDRWEPLCFSLIGSRLVEYLPPFLTCFLEVLWASINLFKVSPRLEIFLSIICNPFSVILLFSWRVHWVRDTDDDRELLTLLTDVLEILVKGGIEGDTTVNFPSSVSDITVMYNNQQNNISEQIQYSSVNLDNSNVNLHFIWWVFLYIEIVYNFSSW